MAHFDLKSFPQDKLVAFYGLLFSAGVADRELEKEELASIYDLIDLNTLDDENKEKVKGYILNPPDVDECLTQIATGGDELRFAVVIGIVEVLLADDIIVEEEQKFLNRVCIEVGVNDDQLKAIINFVKEGKRIQKIGLDDAAAEKALRDVAEDLAAAGIPLTALYFSGTVIGLNAAGITSGLAVLGLGLGLLMVPGLGIAILIGTGLFWGLKVTIGKKKGQTESEEQRKEKKSQITITNLQEAINKLIVRIDELEKKEEQTHMDVNELEELRDKLIKLRKVLNQKQGIIYAKIS